MIKLIVAVSENGTIGNDNKLIWRLKKDLKNFKELTTGSNVIMGRKTFESIGRALPNRLNIVMSTNPENTFNGCISATSLREAFGKCDRNKDTFIIGGGEIYKQSIDYVEEVHLTRVKCDIEGDTKFELDISMWDIISIEKFKKDSNNDHDFSFIHYKRKS